MKLLCLAFLFIVAAVHSAHAQVRPELIGPERAVSVAQERYLGELLDVAAVPARSDEPASTVYEVKLLTNDGQIVRIRIKGDDGAFLEAAGHDLVKASRPPAPAKRGRP